MTDPTPGSGLQLPRFIESWQEPSHPNSSLTDEHPPLPNLAYHVPKRSFRAARILFLIIGLVYLSISSSMATSRNRVIENYRTKAEAKAKEEAGFFWFFQKAGIQKDAETVGRVVGAIGVGFSVVSVIFLVVALITSMFPVSSMLVGVSLYLSVSAFGYYLLLGQPGTSGAANSLFLSVPINFLVIVKLISTLRYAIATRVAAQAKATEIEKSLASNADETGLEIERAFRQHLAEVASDEDDLIVISDEAPPLETVVADLPARGSGPQEIAWLEPAEEAGSTSVTEPLELSFTIPARRRISDICIVLAIAGIVTAVFMGSIRPGLAAIFPVVLAVVMFSHRRPALVGRLAREGIEIQEPRPNLIWYSGILAVDANFADPANPPESFAIRVAHRSGFLTIPASADIDSCMIYHVLLDQIAPHLRPFQHPDLIAYTEKNRQVFGFEKVLTFETNPGLYFAKKNVVGSLALALMITGLAWMIAGATDPSLQIWVSIGIAGLLLGLATALLSFLLRLRQMRLSRMVDWGTSSLVITPLGFALRQGPRLGKVRWDQVSEVQFKPPSRTSQVHIQGRLEQSIFVWVDGMPIEILDIYSASTARIYRRIMAIWQGGRSLSSR